MARISYMELMNYRTIEQCLFVLPIEQCIFVLPIEQCIFVLPIEQCIFVLPIAIELRYKRFIHMKWR